MIDNFLNQATEDIFDGKSSKSARKLLPIYLHKMARRKLDMVDAAKTLEDLKIPPSNKLEKLHGNRKHQHSIRINDQYRVVFTWIEGSVNDVEIVDYH
jgi:proteic killer suppression protein